MFQFQLNISTIHRNRWIRTY